MSTPFSQSPNGDATDTATKVILITGSSSGFGQLSALSLAREGHTVFATMRDSGGRNLEARTAFEDTAAREGLSLHVLDLDVTDDESVNRALRDVITTAGRLDVLVNNAGVVGFGPAEAFTIDQMGRLYDVNVFGVTRATRAALPQMREQGEGLVITVSSGVGRLAMPMLAPYVSSKFAVEGLMESWSYELQPFGVDVAIVQPGAYGTGILGKTDIPAATDRLPAYGDLSGPDFSEDMLGDPQEVADAIVGLVNAPAGKRPLRTLVGTDVAAIQPLNDLHDELRHAFLASFAAEDTPETTPAAAD